MRCVCVVCALCVRCVWTSDISDTDTPNQPHKYRLDCAAEMRERIQTERDFLLGLIGHMDSRLKCVTQIRPCRTIPGLGQKGVFAITELQQGAEFYCYLEEDVNMTVRRECVTNALCECVKCASLMRCVSALCVCAS